MAINLQIKEISDKKVWNDFVVAQNFYTFLQSFEWGEFQSLLGHKILRLGFCDNDELAGVAQVFKIKAKRGVFYLCPHGPLISSKIQAAEVFQNLTAYLKKAGQAEQVDFIRLNTLLLNTSANQFLLKKQGYKFAPMHQHAETTWLLDVSLSQEQLLAQMRKTTRYLINRGEKEGVEVKKEISPEAIKKFISLHQAHSQANHYEAFSADYLQKLFQVFDHNQISLKFACYKGIVEAASIIIYFGKTAAYYLAASKILHPQFSPAYLLQWESIKEAKAQGCMSYNFWGVSPDDNPKHPIYGVSNFKKGFGGELVDFLHAQDYPLTSKYYLNWLVESLRRIKRGYYYLKPKK